MIIRKAHHSRRRSRFPRYNNKSSSKEDDNNNINIPFDEKLPCDDTDDETIASHEYVGVPFDEVNSSADYTSFASSPHVQRRRHHGKRRSFSFDTIASGENQSDDTTHVTSSSDVMSGASTCSFTTTPSLAIQGDSSSSVKHTASSVAAFRKRQRSAFDCFENTSLKDAYADDSMTMQSEGAYKLHRQYDNDSEDDLMFFIPCEGLMRALLRCENAIRAMNWFGGSS